MTIARPRTRGSVRQSVVLLASLAAFFPAIYAQTTPVGTTSATQTATVTFTSAGQPATTDVLTQGAPLLDFKFVAGGSCSAAITYQPGNACTVKYSFTPGAPGQRFGAVQLLDSTGTVVLGTTLLTGTGTGPLAVFPGNKTASLLGNGASEPTGVAVDSAGNVYYAAFEADGVHEIVAADGVVSATSTVKVLGSGFAYTTGVAVDGAGNVFVADLFNGAIKEILAVGGVTSSTSTVITLGSGISIPAGVAVDGKGDVFLTESGYSNGVTYDTVKEIVAVNGVTSSNSTVITIGSGFLEPEGIAVDAKGNVYVADADLGVEEIVAVDGVVSSTSNVVTLASGFYFNSPSATAVDAAGNVYVTSGNSNAVYEIVAVDGTASPSSNVIELASGFSYPLGVAAGGQGNVYVADYGNNLMKEILITTPPSLAFATTNLGSTSSDSPQPIQVQNIGNSSLDFSAFTASSSFAVDATSTTCSTSIPLPLNVFCNVGVNFIPVVDGPLTGTLTLTDNSITAQQSAQLSGTGTGSLPAALISPTPGTTLTGSSATFTWTPGTNVANWQIEIGSSPGGHQYSTANPQYTTTYKATGLPLDGSTVYVRLYSRINNAWQFNDYTYTAYKQGEK